MTTVAASWTSATAPPRGTHGVPVRRPAGRPQRNENGQEDEDEDVLELSEDAQTRHGEHRQNQSQCDRLRAIERRFTRAASPGGLGLFGCGVAI
jgi:hypothetical protein